MKDKTKKKANVAFSALDPYIVDNIPNSKEKVFSGYQWVQWGDRNKFPNFLYDLYNETPTLRAIIEGVCDYVIGDGIKSNMSIMDDEEAEDLLKSIALSYAIYGGFALNVLRNKIGGIAKIICLDMRKVRTSKDNDLFFYSDDFVDKTIGRGKYMQLPKFDKDDINSPSSIFMYKNDKYRTYPTPKHLASLESCLVESRINVFHLNEVSNGFMSNIIVSLNNGVPSDEIKEEIEESIYEKFQGADNAGRPLIVYNQDKEHAVTIEKIDTDNFVDRYNVLYKKVQQDLYTSWRCNPNLFGIPTENNGFNAEEYENSFKLFNRTMIKPIQKIICNSLDKILGTQDNITITPFTLEGTDKKVE